MVLKITQQTFDDAVQENIDILGLEPDEALSETIKQFESQGVDLTAIQRLLKADRPQPQVVQEAVRDLKRHLEESHINPESYVNLLKVLKEECDKGIDYRIFAATAGAYTSLLDIIEKFPENKVLLRDSFRCLLSLMTRHPDLLTDRGVSIITSHLDKNHDQEVLKQLLKWIKECCIMHEMNRQNLFNSKLVGKLKVLLDNDDNREIIRDVLGVFRAMVLDDDVRVEFGKAHEHAKSIASETLMSMINLIKRYQNDEAVTTDLVMTLSLLLVRSEFCKQIEEANGLELIHDVMQNFTESEKVSRQCFKLLKALAGNDECKGHIIQKGFAPIIASSLNYHKKTVQTANAALLAIAALSLRSVENSKALYEAGLPEVIVETLKLHSEEKSIQKSGSWAVRNMVSRSRYQNAQFLDLGIEDILQNDLQKFKEFSYDFKAALRDLECEVKLNEEWTGKGGLLTSDAGKVE